MSNNYPKNYMISSGAGISKYELVAFDSALIEAGISNYNLLRVSSILPSDCKKQERIDLKQGSPLLTAYSTYSSNKMGETIASAIAIGIPEDRNEIGVIMEYAGKCTADVAENNVCQMVRESMDRHKIPLKDIIVSSVDKKVMTDEYISVISAVTMW